jgi:hypothetical protein
MDLEVDLAADLNAQDDDGLGWSPSLTRATVPSSARARCSLPAIRRARRSCESWPSMTMNRSTSRSSPAQSRRTVTSWGAPSRDGRSNAANRTI